MSDYSVDDIVNLMVSGDNVNMKDAFNSLMLDRIGDALDVERVVVAQKMFNKSQSEEPVEETPEEEEND